MMMRSHNSLSLAYMMALFSTCSSLVFAKKTTCGVMNKEEEDEEDEEDEEGEEEEDEEEDGEEKEKEEEVIESRKV